MQITLSKIEKTLAALREQQRVMPPAYQEKALICPTCKVPFKEGEYGWVKEYAPHADHSKCLQRFGYCVVPCPTCSGDALQRIAAKKQAELVARLFGGADIPYDARTWTFSNFPVDADKDALATAKTFVARHLAGLDETVKRGLFLGGESGRGKTSLAISALKAIMEQGHIGLFVMSTELFKRIRATFNKASHETEDELLRAVTQVPWLVLDDLGVEGTTEFILGELYYIIQKRRQQGLYTIFTSNLSMSDLGRRWKPADVEEGQFNAGVRIVERIKEYCVGVSVKSRNLRERR